IRSGKNTVLRLSGMALREKPLAVAGRIAQATGVSLLSQQSNARMERGVGRVAIERVPYPVEQAVAMLKDVENLILVGAKAPVGFFAYPGQPSEMTPPECNIVHLASPGDDLLHALEWLSDELQAGAAETPIVRAIERPDLPVGELN